MEENKQETQAIDSSEMRKKLHVIVEGLADLADNGSDSAGDILMSFNYFGSMVIETKGQVDLKRVTKTCEDQECHECAPVDNK